MENTYHFGTAKRMISPPLGTPLAGYWFLRRAEGVLDDLYARCLAISFVHTVAVFLSLDLINIPSDFTGQIMDRIAAETGLQREDVLISATHTHTGPALSPLMNPEETSAGYLEFLLEVLPVLVQDALASQVPGRLGVGSAVVDGLAFNRRLLNAGGRVVTYKPDTYAAGMTPAGPVDATLRLTCCLGADSKPLAVLANFGLHPDTTGGSLISADYPGVFCQELQRRLGAQTEVIFLNAPCGDINHLNPHQPGDVYTRQNAVRIGMRLAERATSLLDNLRWQEAKPVRGFRKRITLKVRPPDPDTYAAAIEHIQNHTGPADKALSRARSLVQMSARAGERVACELGAISSGELAILGIPAEVFTQTGLDIRTASPFEHTWITGLSNGYIGYIPVQDAFKTGGYETLLGPGSYLEIGASKFITQASLDLLARLKS